MKEADRKKQDIRYLRGKMESRELEEDEIARLNAIGFPWKVQKQEKKKILIDGRLAELWDEEKNGSVELAKKYNNYWFLLDERFRPTVKTEWPHASAVNGIYPEDVADLPTIETAIPRLREIFAGADEIIGYNVGFDLGFLSAVGVRPREDAIITDTMNLFTWFMGRRYKLVDAADHIGYEWTGRAHGSLADALATLAVQRWLEQWLVAE